MVIEGGVMSRCMMGVVSERKIDTLGSRKDERQHLIR